MLYAPLASKHGYVPRVATESVSLVDSHTDEELARFHNTLQDVAKAQKNNPHAVFSPFNVFALLTQAEFSKMLQNSFVGRNISSGPPLAAESALTAGASIDWSTSTCSSSVKAQGDCGNCRAFSAVGTAEFAHCIPTGENLDLSEQQVTSCDTASSGCKGGYPSAAIDYQHNSGICLESAYPYTSDSTGQTGSCQSSCAKKTLSIGETVQTQGEASLVAALNKQPVSVIVESDNEVWRNYKSGVVTHCPGAQSDHAVIAVGYGTSTHDYFKVKNSWGAQWGDNGYIPELTGTTVAPPSPSTDEPTAHPTSSPTPKPSTTRSPITTTTVPTVEPTTTKSPKTKKPPKTKTPTPTTGSPETFAPTESPDTAAPSTSLPSPTAFPTSRSPSKKPVTTAATPAPGASGTGIQRQLITQTNKIRAAHGLGPVTWNAALAAEMQKFADSCPGFNHGGPEGWQNLAPFEPCSGDACLKIAGAAWMWYNDEETKWNYDAHTCNGEWADCGHFSNMMGPGVTQIACGWSQCSNGDSVWCNYESSEMNPVVPRIRGMTKQQLLASLTA